MGRHAEPECRASAQHDDSNLGRSLPADDRTAVPPNVQTPARLVALVQVEIQTEERRTDHDRREHQGDDREGGVLPRRQPRRPPHGSRLKSTSSWGLTGPAYRIPSRLTHLTLQAEGRPELPGAEPLLRALPGSRHRPHRARSKPFGGSATGSAGSECRLARGEWGYRSRLTFVI